MRTPEGLVVLTQSERGTWLRCRRRWWFAYRLRLQRRTPTLREARETGSVVHAVLAEWYGSGGAVDVGAELAWHRAALVDRYTEAAEVEVDQVMDYARLVVEGYLEWLDETGVDARLRVVAPEQDVQVRLPDEAVGREAWLLGRLDLQVDDLVDEARSFVDLKVVGDLTRFPRWAHLSPQMLFYHLLHQLEAAAAEAATGEPQPRVEAGIYRLLRRTKRTARARPPFYAELVVHHGLDQLRSFYRTTIAVLGEIERAEARLDGGESDMVVCPPSPADDCTWSCEFFTACALRDEGADLEGYLADVYVEGSPLARYGADDGGAE